MHHLIAHMLTVIDNGMDNLQLRSCHNTHHHTQLASLRSFCINSQIIDN